MKIIPYQKKYKADCIAIFKSNQPLYFTEEELALFTKFLDEKCDEEYFVLEYQGKILACGGIFNRENRENTSGLSWGMVHNDYHQKGLGFALTDFRLKLLKEKYPQSIPTINTSQYTYPFYQKLGFVTHKITKDGFGKGLDDYEMRLEYRD